MAPEAHDVHENAASPTPPEPNDVHENAKSPAPKPNDAHENATSPSHEVDGQQPPIEEATDDKSKTPRHPRWTRQETMVLIEGKKVAENRGRRGRRCGSGAVLGSDGLEPKWDFVSSYCKQHHVNRGPVQCRKRWSNLVGDFKKIKTWESLVKDEAESFWMLRNDMRRENKLPGFFDSEVYRVLDGKAFSAAAFPLPLVAIDSKDIDDGVEAVMAEEADEEEEESAEAVFDSSRHATAEDGLFSDFEQPDQEIGRSSEKKTVVEETTTKRVHAPIPISGFCSNSKIKQGTAKGKQSTTNFCRGSMSHEGWKRRRLSFDGCSDTNLEGQLTEVLERNSDMLNAQLEAHNTNCQLDMKQRRDHNDSLVAALSKITDALVRIADKL
ncbi:trihelix transcription factor ASR3-like isoform X2 [Cornus florida]|uniref:trihelix transcription factor ASR3-like isoform X2 n=1 Tax=Cornus florida TaxID=4283 RepID=UPI00289F022B|nr:trihelix transcription factor ASR3-like isoform X2 [Cornus florida]